MKHLIVGQAQAEINIPLILVDDAGGKRDVSVVLVAKVEGEAGRINVKDFIVRSMSEVVPMESIKRALQEGWAPLSNEQPHESLQQTCLAGI